MSARCPYVGMPSSVMPLECAMPLCGDALKRDAPCMGSRPRPSRPLPAGGVMLCCALLHAVAHLVCCGTPPLGGVSDTSCAICRRMAPRSQMRTPLPERHVCTRTSGRRLPPCVLFPLPCACDSPSRDTRLAWAKRKFNMLMRKSMFSRITVADLLTR